MSDARMSDESLLEIEQCAECDGLGYVDGLIAEARRARASESALAARVRELEAGIEELYCERNEVIRVYEERLDKAALSDKDLTDENFALRDSLNRANDEVCKWIQAFGLVSTIAGDMQIDVMNPQAMAEQIVEHVKQTRRTAVESDTERTLARYKAAHERAMGILPYPIHEWQALSNTTRANLEGYNRALNKAHAALALEGEK